MEGAVALVQAYLYANGYFTVTEYPIIAPAEEGRYQAATDIDVLATRFPGAGRYVPSPDGQTLDGGRIIEPDPALETTEEFTELLIGEVKEGEAVLNGGTRNHGVLRVALARFGAAPDDVIGNVIEELEATGMAVVLDDVRIRLVAFGASRPQGRRRRYHVITLDHIARFIRQTVSEHWCMARTAQFKDPALSLLMVLEKARRAAEAEASPEPEA